MDALQLLALLRPLVQQARETHPDRDMTIVMSQTMADQRLKRVDGLPVVYASFGHNPRIYLHTIEHCTMQATQLSAEAGF